MEILYIWISEYKNIKNQGFNFGGKYIFNFDNKIKELKINKNENYIKDFYNILESPSLSKIVNITGVIGENGSGKSNLLEFIKTQIATNYISVYSIVAFENDNKIYIYSYNDSKINFDDKNAIVSEFFNYDKDSVDDPYKSIHVNDLLNVSFIYFSNMYDGKYEFLHEKLFNISTNALIKNDIEAFYDDKHIYDYEDRRFYNNVEIHKKLDRKRQLLFLVSDFGKTFDFNISNIIKLSIDDFDFNYIKAMCRDDKDSNAFANYLFELENKLFYKHVRLNNSIDNFINYWCIVILFTYLRNYYGITKVLDFFPKENFEDSNKNLEDFVVKYLNHIKNNEPSQKGNVDILLDQISHFISLLKENITEIKNIKYYSIELQISDKTKKIIDNFIDILDLDFIWQNFSTGQNAMLNLYSRFYDLFNTEKTRLKDNIVILIDEAELGFHPQWQKEYLNRVINYFQHLFTNNDSDSGERKIQIVLTSNSPFIASDIPKNNIIFLKRIDELCNVIEGIDEQDETFAANIFNLYTNSFFVKKGLIGDFSKKKIDNLINKINNYDLSLLKPSDINEITKLISIIGEPLIRKNLQSIIRDKLNTDLISLYYKVNLLEEKIEELKNEENNKI